MTGRSLLRLALLWLAGISLRLTILSVPPLVPLIHHGLHLTETLVGALTAFPILVLGGAAVPGSLLIARLGARRALLVGLALVAFAGAARGVGPSTPILFGMTLLMGVGIAVSQPSLPSIVRAWFPARAPLATAVYANGFLVGEVIAAAVTTPLVVPLVGGSWELALLVWSVPVLLTAVAMVISTSHAPREPDAVSVRWWPNWRSPTTWRLGLIFGCASAGYYGSNAFIPDYLRAEHHGALITAALTSLNLAQLPASFIIGAFPGLFVARRWPIVVSGFLMLAGSLGYAMGGVPVVVWAGVLGFSTAVIFVVLLALPPLLGGADDVHLLSAAMFTITYACSFGGSLIGGAVWDATRIPYTSFVPVIAAGILMSVLGAGLRLPSETRRAARSPSTGDGDTADPRLGGRTTP